MCKQRQRRDPLLNVNIKIANKDDVCMMYNNHNNVLIFSFS